MEIKIGIGIDKIFFGMYQNEIKIIWGEPDKISNSERDKSIVYYYNEKMIKLNFDEEKDSRLYSVEIFNPQMIMFCKGVFNKSKEDIIILLEENGYLETEYEDYDFFETIFCEDIWTTFKFEFNKLNSIEFSPLYGDNDEIIWPNRA